MKLVMYIGNDFIDAIPLEQSFIVFPGYVSHFVKALIKKHEMLILESVLEPGFLLDGYEVKKQEQAISFNDHEVFIELGLMELAVAI